jgi:hypothetical protein
MFAREEEALTTGNRLEASAVTAWVTPPRRLITGARTPALAVICWFKVRREAGVMAPPSAQIQTLDWISSIIF